MRAPTSIVPARARRRSAPRRRRSTRTAAIRRRGRSPTPRVPAPTPSAAATLSLTSSSSGASGAGSRPLTTTGSPDHVGSSVPSTWINVAIRDGPSDAVARRHHAPRRLGGVTNLRHRAEDAELGTRNVGRAHIHLVGRPRLDSLRAEVQQQVRRVGAGDELIDGHGGASPGGPGRHRHRGTEPGHEGEDDRRDAVAPNERAGAHQCRLTDHAGIVPSRPRIRPPWCHIGGEV